MLRPLIAERQTLSLSLRNSLRSLSFLLNITSTSRRTSQVTLNRIVPARAGMNMLTVMKITGTETTGSRTKILLGYAAITVLHFKISLFILTSVST